MERSTNNDDEFVVEHHIKDNENAFEIKLVIKKSVFKQGK